MNDLQALWLGAILLVTAGVVIGCVIGFIIGSIRSERESASAYNVGVTRRKIHNITPAQNG